MLLADINVHWRMFFRSTIEIFVGSYPHPGTCRVLRFSKLDAFDRIVELMLV